ncbi:MAG: 30S ribosomal protein S20 [Alphaproteobacteria bacterium]
MANHKSSKKRAKRNVSRAKVNSARLSAIRTSIKKIEVALSSGDVKVAEEALKKVKPQISRGVAKGTLNKQTASRKVSRLSAKIKKLKNSAKG